MERKIETLRWFWMGVVVAFTLVNVYTTFNKPRKAETTLVQKNINIRTPYIRMLPQEDSTVTIPLKKQMKLELNATLEEFQYYFLNNQFTNRETTKDIVIIGEKVADDSKDIKWTIY